MPVQSFCTRCGHVSSQAVCKACVLLEGLNKGKPKLGIGKSSKVTQRMKEDPTSLIEEDSNDKTGCKSDFKSTRVYSAKKVNKENSSDESTSKQCASKVGNIEDIGSKESTCSSGGNCSGDCKNKKTRKVISLRENPDLVTGLLENMKINKNDLDF